jgi:hypothetical protein
MEEVRRGGIETVAHEGAAPGEEEDADRVGGEAEARGKEEDVGMR